MTTQGFAHELVAPPARKASKASKAGTPAAVVESPRTPAELSAASIGKEHRAAKASKAIRLLLGSDAKGKAVRLTLSPITAHTGSGEKRRAGWSVCHEVTNPDNAVRYFSGGRPVGFGDMVAPPRTGAGGFASTTFGAVLVGFGLSEPTAVTLAPVDGRAGTVGSEYGATVTDASGAVWSVTVQIRTPKAAGSPWTVNARIFSGGAVAPTAAELVADAAVAARCPSDELRSAADALDGVTPAAAPKAARKTAVGRARKASK